MIEEGDTICILNSVIDNVVAQALIDNKNKKAIQWESYYNVAFIVASVGKNNSVTVYDTKGREIKLAAHQYEKQG